MTLSSNIRTAREALGWSQDRLAAEVGVTKATVSAWENGKKWPESPRLPEISRALRTGLDALFGTTVRAPVTPYPMAPSRANAGVNDSERKPDQPQDAIADLSPDARRALAAFVASLARPD